MEFNPCSLVAMGLTSLGTACCSVDRIASGSSCYAHPTPGLTGIAISCADFTLLVYLHRCGDSPCASVAFGFGWPSRIGWRVFVGADPSRPKHPTPILNWAHGLTGGYAGLASIRGCSLHGLAMRTLRIPRAIQPMRVLQLIPHRQLHPRCDAGGSYVGHAFVSVCRTIFSAVFTQSTLSLAFYTQSMPLFTQSQVGSAPMEFTTKMEALALGVLYPRLVAMDSLVLAPWVSSTTSWSWTTCPCLSECLFEFVGWVQPVLATVPHRFLGALHALWTTGISASCLLVVRGLSLILWWAEADYPHLLCPARIAPTPHRSSEWIEHLCFGLHRFVGAPHACRALPIRMAMLVLVVAGAPLRLLVPGLTDWLHPVQIGDAAVSVSAYPRLCGWSLNPRLTGGLTGAVQRCPQPAHPSWCIRNAHPYRAPALCLAIQLIRRVHPFYTRSTCPRCQAHIQTGYPSVTPFAMITLSVLGALITQVVSTHSRVLPSSWRSFLTYRMAMRRDARTLWLLGGAGRRVGNRSEDETHALRRPLRWPFNLCAFVCSLHTGDTMRCVVSVHSSVTPSQTHGYHECAHPTPWPHPLRGLHHSIDSVGLLRNAHPFTCA